MKKYFYRTDFLYSKGSFFIGMGSILSIFNPYFDYNCSDTSEQADRIAIESDFGTIGKDISQAMTAFKENL